MKNSKQTLLFIILITITLIFAALGCSLNLSKFYNSDDIGEQETRSALKESQVALESQPQDESETTKPPIEAQTVIATRIKESVTIPTDITDQMGQTQRFDVSYEGVNFSFDQSIAQVIFPATIPGNNSGEDASPGENYPTYFEFTFDTYTIRDHFHSPIIRVYPVDELRMIDPQAAETIDNLQQTLKAQPVGGHLSNFPFLPLWPAAQMFAAKVNYFDFENGSGVSFLTMYSQDIYPIDNQHLFYTYQGLTSDGDFYISAILPITNAGLPNDGDTIISEYQPFEENFEAYLAKTLTWLEAQGPSTFIPHLNELDEMMASFQIDR